MNSQSNVRSVLAQSISSVAPVPTPTLRKSPRPLKQPEHDRDVETSAFESPHQSFMDSNIAGRGPSPTTPAVTLRFTSMCNTGFGGTQMTKRRLPLNNGRVLCGGEMVKFCSPKSIKIDENGGPIPSDREIKHQQAVVLEPQGTIADHNHLSPHLSTAVNIQNERTTTIKSMVRDTKILLRNFSLEDRKKLIQLHKEALLQAT